MKLTALLTVLHWFSIYNLTWKEELKGWEVRGKNCPQHIRIPGYYEDNDHRGNVVEIAQYAFEMCSIQEGMSRSIFIPKEVKFIRSGAFFGSYYIDTFEIEPGSQLEEIEYVGLHFIGYKCSNLNFTTLYLPSTITYLAEQSIYRCFIFNRIVYLGWNILPNSNHWIDSSMDIQIPEFIVTDLYPQNQTIFGYEIPKLNKTITDEACKIHRCMSYVNVNNEYWIAGDYSKGLTSANAFNGSRNCPRNEIIVLPTFAGLPVRKIAPFAFKGCKTNTIILPKTITEIGESAFADNSNVTSFSITEPSELEAIGTSGFEGFGSDREGELVIKLPSHLVSIGENAFNNSGFDEVSIGKT